MLILTTLLSLCTSCRESDQERVARLVQEWQGKEIVFPEGLVFTRFVKDTVDYRIPESDYKVLVYVDSVGCTSCKLQLHKWKSFIAHVDSATGGNVPFLFFFQSKDDKELRYLLKRDNFNRPVCIDHANRMNAKNNFPQDMTFQTVAAVYEAIILKDVAYPIPAASLTGYCMKNNPSIKYIRQ